MKKIINTVLIALALSVFVPAPAFAGQLEDAEAALNRKDYDTALQLLRPLAEQGNAEAQAKIADMYEKGLGVPKDHTEAMKWENKAAESDVNGIISSVGLAPPPCVPADDRDPVAGYNALTCGDYATALRIFRPQAEQGAADAQWVLGGMYEHGRGVTVDFTEAEKWYHKAADQGNAAAQSSLGYMYNWGEGVTQDYAEAIKFYRLAAAQGNDSAERALGEIYKAGNGVQKNDAEATKWTHKADNKINAAEEYARGISAYNGGDLKPNAPHDYSGAMEHFHKAADYGNIEALSMIGMMYERGNGVQKSQTDAVKWYRHAANQGDSEGQYSLGNMYESGKGVLLDYVQAYMWYNLAAAGTSDESMRWMYTSSRDDIAKKMTPEQIAEAQKLSREWKPNN